jgi:hypothetical protein
MRHLCQLPQSEELLVYNQYNSLVYSHQRSRIFHAQYDEQLWRIQFTLEGLVLAF